MITNKLFRLLLLLAVSLNLFISCSDDNNPLDPGPEPTPEPTPGPVVPAHPYAKEIRDNGVIIAGPIKGDRSFVADSVYYLDGYVFQESGKLTIEPGTVVLFFSTPSEVAEGNASSLIITRNAQIDAQGTPDKPIIFTSEFDEEPFGGPIVLNQTNSKLWAGIILLGNAPSFSNGNTDAIQIEGIVDADARSQYGGDEADHSSGIMRYVSIRFTGAEIGPGNEIQGLTGGGVGRGTTLEYIDIFVSGDDGIELFGGTVDIRNISVAFAEDDSFDFDLGWSGNGQYLFALQGGNGGDRTSEWDGATPDNAPLYSTGRLYNMTLVGEGMDSGNRETNPSVLMRDGSAYSLINSVIAYHRGFGLEIEDKNDAQDSYDKTVLNVNGDGAAIAGNMWWVGNGTNLQTMLKITNPAVSRDSDGSATAAWLTDLNNRFEDPELGGVCRTNKCGTLNPIPTNANALTGASTKLSVDGNIDQTAYIGAFEPGQPLWIAGWTTLARYGYLAN